MTVEKYLKENKAVNLSEVAKLMFPNNKSAKSYLVNKLNKNANRMFTKSDAESALSALKKLYGTIDSLTID